MQNHVDPTAIEAVAFCKRALTAFTFNCGAQQVNNVIFFKHRAPLARSMAACHGYPQAPFSQMMDFIGVDLSSARSAFSAKH
jgi:hypothetical protein